MKPTARTAALAWLQAAPLAAVFAVFFLIPLGLIGMVSFWQATDYELIPAFSAENYLSIFQGCGDSLVTVAGFTASATCFHWPHTTGRPSRLELPQKRPEE